MSESKSETAKLAAVLGVGNEPVTLTIRGEQHEFPVNPFEAWQILEELKCLEALSEAGVVDLDGSKTFNQYKLITRGGYHALRMIAIAVTPDEDGDIGGTATLLRKAKAVDLVKLFGTIYKRNKDFFVQSQDELLGVFGVTAEQLSKLKQGYRSIKSLLNLYLAASPSAKSGASLLPKSPPLETNTTGEIELS
jgi:hypothetical protein